MERILSAKFSCSQVKELSDIIEIPGLKTYFGMQGDKPIAIINAPVDYNPQGLKKVSEEELSDKKFEVHSYCPINPKYQELIIELNAIRVLFPDLIFDAIHIINVKRISSKEQMESIISAFFRKVIQDEIDGSIVIYSTPEMFQSVFDIEDVAYAMRRKNQ